MIQIGKFSHAIILYKVFYNKIVFILRDCHSSQDTKDWNTEGSGLMLGKYVICCQPFCGLNLMTSVLGVLAYILKDHTHSTSRWWCPHLQANKQFKTA
jgi:hypothetical protein